MPAGRRTRRARGTDSGLAEGSELRIIGGSLRGRRFLYHGDPVTRPMKERVREAVFNLVGPAIRGKTVVDLFSGTGALALEAISRGARQAIAIERHLPTARCLERNARALGIDGQITLLQGDAFFWGARPDTWNHGSEPTVIFCSPPYDLYLSRGDDLRIIVERLWEASLPESVLVVEHDARFDVETAWPFASWDQRTYAPAVVALARKEPVPTDPS